MTAAQDVYLGPAAGVATSVLWSMTALCFTAASKRIGATAVNATRIVLAVIWHGLTYRWLAGQWIPPASARQAVYLALSGLVGLTIGDLALFASFVHIGPRLAMLVMTAAPIFAGLLGWVALGETLGPTAWLGVALTLFGVGWVVLERPAAGSLAPGTRRFRGLFLAFVAMLCQAGGSLLSKAGMGHGWLPEDRLLGPQAASLIRMFFAGVFMIPVLVTLRYSGLGGSGRRTAQQEPRNRSASYLFTACGSVVGPYLGVWMSLEAFHRTPLGVGQTLCSLVPVFILPLVIVIQKERVSARAALGALIAVAGTGVLFLPGAGH